MDNLSKKSRDFAVRIVYLSKYLNENKEFTLSKQILRSGTSIGANIAESRYAQSKADFISKHSIALKEASETSYWLDLLYETNYITEKQYQSMNNVCTELIKILTAIINKSKNTSP